MRGEDLDESRRIAGDVLEILKEVPGIANPQIGREEGRPELAIRVDRPKAALLGLTVSGVASTIRTNISGTQAAMFRERGKEFPIIVRLRQEDRDRVESVNDVLISTPQGLVLQAKNLLDMTAQKGPTQIERKNQQRLLRVNAELDAGTVLGDGVKAVQARLPEVNVPQGFQVGFGAEVEQQAQAFNQLQVLLILGVLLVYAVMSRESLRELYRHVPVPWPPSGGRRPEIDVNVFQPQAYMANMLGGIVVSNAIPLVDYTNILRRRDGALREAVELADGPVPPDPDDDSDDHPGIGRCHWPW